LRKSDFDHVIAAASDLTGGSEIVVIGSQAIVGVIPEPPEELTRSLEADIYPLQNRELAIEIEGTLGDGSPFHDLNGFYAHVVGPETAKAPEGWEERLIPVQVQRRPGKEGYVTALCLEPHDLILAKCVAGRDRDWQFAADALGAGIVDLEELLRRIPRLPVSQESRDRIETMIRARAPSSQI
jgi:hypothetical protein